jgi:hypothetical protein
MRSNCLNKLATALQIREVDTYLQQAISVGIQRRFENTVAEWPHPVPPHTDHCACLVHDAFYHQDTIGWSNMIRGRVYITWFQAHDFRSESFSLDHGNNSQRGWLSDSSKNKIHNRKDDVVIALRVFLMIVLLVVLIDEDKGSRWRITIIIAFLLIVFLSVFFLVKGSEVPQQNDRNHKWEYLSLFFFLVFAAGISIAFIRQSTLKSKYGKAYFGAARIVAFNEEDDDVSDLMFN